jgi:hypothetical protein
MSQLKISLSSLTEIKPVGKKKLLEIKKLMLVGISFLGLTH